MKILSIIGIVILTLVLLLFLLFVLPITTKLKLKYDDNILDVVFLLGFIKVLFFADFNDRLKMKLKILGISVIDTDKEDTRKVNNLDISKKKFFKNRNIDKEVTDNENASNELIVAAKKYDKTLVKKQKNETVKVKKKFDPFAPIKSLLNMIKSAGYLVKAVFRQIRIYYRYFVPDDFDLKVVIGGGNPFIMGLILSFFAPFYSKYGDKIIISPRIEDKFKIDFFAITKIQLIFLIFPVINLLLDKKVRKFIFNKK